jgi:vancomycin permeability regulator SanA
MSTYILILGNTNDDQGNLSSIAEERLETGLKHYVEGRKFILTGGFGDYFNTSKEPHSYHLKSYLIKKGVKNEDMLTITASCGTIEDLNLAKKLISMDDHLIIITSDFHMVRVKLISYKTFKGQNLTFFSSVTNLSSDKLETLNRHEAKAISKFLK